MRGVQLVNFVPRSHGLRSLDRDDICNGSILSPLMFMDCYSRDAEFLDAFWVSDFPWSTRARVQEQENTMLVSSVRKCILVIIGAYDSHCRSYSGGECERILNGM